MQIYFLAMFPLPLLLLLLKLAMASEHTCNQRVLSLCPICSLIKRQDHYTGALAHMQRSTMGKKMWLSMLPRNFGSAKIVCMYDCMYIRPDLLSKPV